MMTAISRRIAVAKKPDPGALTYQEVVDGIDPDAEIVSPAFVNEATPEGHFGVTIVKEGKRETYWFSGARGDEDAQVVARTVHSRRCGPLGAMHYLGSQLGGRYYGGSPYVRGKG